MSGGVKRKCYAVDGQHFTVRESLDIIDQVKPVPYNRQGIRCAEIMFMAGIGVVGMAVADDGPLYGFPRIEVDTRPRAEDPPVGELE